MEQEINNLKKQLQKQEKLALISARCLTSC